MPTNSKPELLTKMDTDFAKLGEELQGVRNQLRDWEDGSILDTVLQNAHWLGLFFSWLEAGACGADVAIPAPGYSMNTQRSYNAAIRHEHSGTDWDSALDRLHNRHHRLRDWVEAQTGAALFTPGIPPWTGKWSLGRLAESSSSLNYRATRKFIRACQRHNPARDDTAPPAPRP